MLILINSTGSGTRTHTDILSNRFSCYTCFYTSQLKISLYHSKEQLSDTIFVTAAFYISTRCSLCLWTLILCFDKLLQSRLFLYHIRNVATYCKMFQLIYIYFANLLNYSYPLLLTIISNLGISYIIVFLLWYTLLKII